MTYNVFGGTLSLTQSSMCILLNCMRNIKIKLLWDYVVVVL